MEQFLYKISETLGLQTAPTIIDLVVVLAILFLVFITVFNLLSSPKKTKTTEVLPEKKSEPVAKAQTVEQIVKEKTEIVEEKKSEPEVEPEPEPVVETIPWNKRLFAGLSKTRSGVWKKIGSVLSAKGIGEEALEELEEILYTSDLSPVLVDELIQKLQKVGGDDHNGDYLEHIKIFLKSKMQTAQEKVNKELYKFDKPDGNGPKVIMIVGVNGAGKTTTIGKLATKLKQQGANVVVGACDTFRAAAVEQLEVWCKRAGVDIVKAGEGADPSGVAFDAVKQAKESNADYCIIDTAGRLHTKSNLMDELAKTKKVMSKVISGAPHETLLVVDAITGQNALRQAEEFNKALALSGLIFTKCDGSSKAGSAVSIVETLDVPIVYIGVGEEVADLDIFDLDAFLDALLGIEA